MSRRSPSKNIISIAALLVVCAVAGITMATKGRYFFVQTQNPAPLMVGSLAAIKAPPGAPQIRILFYGNSYTIVNDLPQQISNLGASDRKNPIDIQVASVTQGGVTLSELWAQPRAHEAMTLTKWDYVVLQEMSISPAVPEMTWYMHEAIKAFNTEIRKVGAKPVLYTTWARKQGSAWYTDSRVPSLHQFKVAEDMQLQVDKVTNAFAAEIQAQTVPVGDYFMMCKAQPGMPQLYNQDGTHASPAGTYLAALVFYRKLTGHSLDDVTYISPGISTKDAAKLRKCAS